MTEETLKWREFANDLVSSYLGVTNSYNQAVKCAQISAKKMKEQFEVVGALLPDSNEVVNENIRFITGVCEVLEVKRIKSTIKPHQVFVDEIKTLINAYFVDNNNYEGGHFFNYGGVDAAYRNLVNYNKEYGKYIIDKIESIKHLVEPDAEFDGIDSVTATI
jgi:hypothetical protein